MLSWLERDDPFPPVETALRNPSGLLCAGADLSPERLLDAYQRGIFPWFSGGEPILWWSPDPRMVLFCNEFKLPRSLSKSMRNKGYRVTADRAFDDVVSGCSKPRRDGAGTWLGRDMRLAYGALHRLGYAHSFETWLEDRLIGGLYGVAIGRMFYGESMFSRETDASKVALAALVAELSARGCPMIDCQQRTPLLESLGGREIPRADFLRSLAALVNYPATKERWDLVSAQ